MPLCKTLGGGRRSWRGSRACPLAALTILPALLLASCLLAAPQEPAFLPATFGEGGSLLGKGLRPVIFLAAELTMGLDCPSPGRSVVLLDRQLNEPNFAPAFLPALPYFLCLAANHLPSFPASPFCLRHLSHCTENKLGIVGAAFICLMFSAPAHGGKQPSGPGTCL